MSVEIYQSDDLELEIQVCGDRAIAIPCRFIEWAGENSTGNPYSQFAKPQDFSDIKGIDIHEVLTEDSHTYHVLWGKSIEEWINEPHFGRTL